VTSSRYKFWGCEDNIVENSSERHLTAITSRKIIYETKSFLGAK